MDAYQAVDSYQPVDPMNNPWEAAAHQYTHPPGEYTDSQATLFVPGVYSRDQYDMLSILANIHTRPNPQIDIGPVDFSCAMILCDLTKSDDPIVYANDAFCYMTGYTLDEVRGKNCRFLQAPGGKVKARSTRAAVDERTLRKMRKAVDKRTEVQLTVRNFKKDGQPFDNILTMIPIKFKGKWLCMGFQCEKE
ncbi:vivid PAS protein VVD [Immersiella caudata]|uniref:Vivid PAS protein VVD n=1 Tax=Immersiella caudata TaxID=314043 RepID=A0AA39WKY1_9PEZI|nr:vivid PAS protein VVD [Immersiella caudata]